MASNDLSRLALFSILIFTAMTGPDQAFEKTTYYTKIGDQICGVGYYAE